MHPEITATDPIERRPPRAGRGLALLAAALLEVATAGAGLAGDARTAEAYLSANATYVRETLPAIVKGCAAKAPEDAVVSFDLTLTVGRGGKVVGAKSDPSNAFSACVTKAARESKLTEPPEDPTDVYVEVSIAR